VSEALTQRLQKRRARLQAATADYEASKVVSDRLGAFFVLAWEEGGEDFLMLALAMFEGQATSFLQAKLGG